MRCQLRLSWKIAFGPVFSGSNELDVQSGAYRAVKFRSEFEFATRPVAVRRQCH